MEMTDLHCLYRRMTLKIMARSPKSKQPFPPFINVSTQVRSNPFNGSKYSPGKPYLGNYILEYRYDRENLVRVTIIPSIFYLFPTMYLCEFGQDPSTGSEDNTRKPYFGHFNAPV